MSEQVLEQPAQGPSPLAGPVLVRPKGPIRSYLENLETSSRDSLGSAAAIALVWGILILVTTLHKRDFLSHQTLLSITFTMAVLGVATVAQSLVTVSGGILDLSIPTAMILPAWVIVTLLGHGVNIALVILVGLLTGAAWGTLNALIIVFGKLNPLIVTLGTNFAGIALVNIYLQSAQTPLGSGLAKWGQSQFLGLPDVFWAMAIFIFLAGYFLKHSRVGRRVVAVGGNPQAARVRGISLRKTRFAVFIGSGVICGLAAVLFTASTLNFVSSETTSYLLPTVAATILAGIRLQGGSGNLWVILLKRRVARHRSHVAGVLWGRRTVAKRAARGNPYRSCVHRRPQAETVQAMTMSAGQLAQSDERETSSSTRAGWFSQVFGGATGSIALTFVVVLLVGLFWVGPEFYTSANLTIIATAAAVPLLVGTCSGFALLAGVVDLSIGSCAGMCAAAFAYLTVHHWGPWVAAGLVVLIGVIVGLTNALVIVGFGANALAATLGMLTVLLGLQYVICGGDGLITSLVQGLYNFSNRQLGAGTSRVRIDPFVCRCCLLRGRLYAAGPAHPGHRR